jgi:hypothetical protein
MRKDALGGGGSSQRECGRECGAVSPQISSVGVMLSMFRAGFRKSADDPAALFMTDFHDS